MNWKSIETAPSDTVVLTYRKAGLMSVAEYIPVNALVREWCCTDGMFLVDVTHGMPLPEPPK
jgi:hypothetical protein